MIEFKPWPKVARLFRDCTVTEKIDGINAAIIIAEDGSVGAQSRTRLVSPEADHRGFAKWVYEHAGELSALLSVGHHFGEWWGKGIGRKYGLAENRFSLFNTARYSYPSTFHAVVKPETMLLRTVPVLYQGPFSTEVVDEIIHGLRLEGSSAAPGFMRPEGVVVYLPASGTMYKVTLENDEVPKGKVVV